MKAAVDLSRIILKLNRLALAYPRDIRTVEGILNAMLSLRCPDEEDDDEYPEPVKPPSRIVH